MANDPASDRRHTAGPAHVSRTISNVYIYIRVYSIYASGLLFINKTTNPTERHVRRYRIMFITREGGWWTRSEIIIITLTYRCGNQHAHAWFLTPVYAQPLPFPHSSRHRRDMLRTERNGGGGIFSPNTLCTRHASIL